MFSLNALVQRFIVPAALGLNWYQGGRIIFLDSGYYEGHVNEAQNYYAIPGLPAPEDRRPNTNWQYQKLRFTSEEQANEVAKLLEKLEGQGFKKEVNEFRY